MRAQYKALCLWAVLIASACDDGEPSAAESGEDDGGIERFPIDPATGLRVPAHGPVPALPDWPDNQATDAKKVLGKALFFDRRLSGSGATACSTCHFGTTLFHSGIAADVPDRSFPARTPLLPRHTPSLLNVVYAPMLRWDGSHFTDFFDMFALPLAEANMDLAQSTGPEDLGFIDVEATQIALKNRLTELSGYGPLFRDAFEMDVSKASPAELYHAVGKAITVYLRVAVSRDAPFDRWNRGDDRAMAEDAVRGLVLFTGKARCSACHAGPLFSDFRFHNVATELPNEDGSRDDEGRFLVTREDEDRGAFLTPTLRSVALTTPYLHNGSERDLRAVIRMKTGSAPLRDPNHDRLLEDVPELSPSEVDDLVAFLKALNGAPIPAAEIALPPLP